MKQPQVVVNAKHPTFKQKLTAMYEKVVYKITHPRTKKRPFDPVDQASKESFPASDPPAWSHRPVF